MLDATVAFRCLVCSTIAKKPYAAHVQDVTMGAARADGGLVALVCVPCQNDPGTPKRLELTGVFE